MSEHQREHWVLDEGLLEEYVLGRVEPPRIGQLEHHLARCEECRTAVARERHLVAGIRRAGREAMKHRLNERVSLRLPAEVGWYRIAGIAAAIVVLITIGIYGNWFWGGGQQPTTTQESVDRGEKQIAHEPANLPQEKIVSPQRSPSDAVRRLAEAESPAAPGVAEQAAREEETGKKKSDETLADGSLDSKKGRADAAAARLGSEDKLVAAPSLAVTETWIEGRVIGGEERDRAQVQMLPADANEIRQLSKRGKLEQKQAEMSVGAARSASLETQNVRVRQQLRSNLPQSQRGQKGVGRLIETLVEKSPTGLTMTLYLDSLVAGKDLESASIQTVDEDSIILNLGDQRIGYRLPAALNIQSTHQKKLK